MNRIAMAVWIAVTYIVENQSSESIQMIPNTTTGELKIEICNMRREIRDIEIFDMMGRKQNVLDISNLSARIYFVKIKTNQETITKQIIKM
jgi:hypothetical protein